jgi:hypothetical protein
MPRNSPTWPKPVEAVRTSRRVGVGSPDHQIELDRVVTQFGTGQPAQGFVSAGVQRANAKFSLNCPFRWPFR